METSKRVNKDSDGSSPKYVRLSDGMKHPAIEDIKSQDEVPVDNAPDSENKLEIDTLPDFQFFQEKNAKELRRRSSKFGRRMSNFSYVAQSNSNKLSFKEQLQGISKDLPITTYRARVLEICLNESLERFQKKFPDHESLISYCSQNSGSWCKEYANNNAYDFNRRELKETEHRLNSSRVEFYKEKSEALKKEYKVWKQIKHNRKEELRQAKRILAEAECGDLKIGPEQYEKLNKAQKSILLSKPNYEESMKTIKEFREGLRIAKLKFECDSYKLNRYLEHLQLRNNCVYSKIENKFYEGVPNAKTVIKNILSMSPPSDMENTFSPSTQGL